MCICLLFHFAVLELRHCGKPSAYIAAGDNAMFGIATVLYVQL